MAINSFSTYSVYLSNLGGFQKLQSSLNDLTAQLASMKKSTDLTTYGASGQRLLDLRADADKRQGYIDATTAASTDVKSYDQVFTSMETLTSNMLQAFTAPDSDPPTKQVNTVTFDGDLGDVGDVYKTTVDGQLFSYITNGSEGSYEEIAGNFARQINSANPPVRATAVAKGDQLVITGAQPGPLYDVTAQVSDVAGGETNTMTQTLTTAGKVSPIVGQVGNALVTLQSLLNETVNNRYLFGGQTINDIAPVVDLSRLPDPTGSKNSASGATTQQLATGTTVQQMRVTADELGTNQTETFALNGNNFTVTGPLTAQQVANQVATYYSSLPALTGVVGVSDVDASGFTLTSATPGTGFTATVTGTDPTPSVIDTVQSNVPIGATQNDVLTFSGPVGSIGETYSVTITDPPAHTSPVTLTYRSTGDEKSMDDVVNALISSIGTYQPPFGVTATALGNGQMRISGSSAFVSSAAVENSASVATTQRTVLPVAQEEQVGFPGMRGDTGDVYTINFTSPVAGPFSVTTNNNDNEAGIAAKFAQQINAAGIGLTAAVKNGKLALTSNTPGTPFTYTAALTTDVGQPTPAPTTTTTVANIPAGATPQSDTVSFSGPAGGKGEVYSVTVNGRTVEYKTTGGEASMDAIVIQLASQINAANPPMGVSASPGPVGSGKLVITANTGGIALATTAKTTPQTVVTDPAPTEYNVHQQTGDSDLAWDRAPITIADQLTISYTFSANEPAIQRLVAALRIAQSAVTDPGQYADKMTQAQSLARNALEGIRALHSVNTVNDTLMSATSLSHKTQINVNTDSTEKIEGIDPNEVAAKIQNAQVQLQAVFSVVGSTGKMSLVNFLT
jgi:flagellar hook-basal body complex protein FliE